MSIENHVKYFEKEIQSKLEQLPRAIQGKAPMSRLEKICEEIKILKEAKEHFEHPYTKWTYLNRIDKLNDIEKILAENFNLAKNDIKIQDIAKLILNVYDKENK